MAVTFKDNFKSLVLIETLELGWLVKCAEIIP